VRSESQSYRDRHRGLKRVSTHNPPANGVNPYLVKEDDWEPSATALNLDHQTLVLPAASFTQDRVCHGISVVSHNVSQQP
jgi:hypothetical protein